MDTRTDTLSSGRFRGDWEFLSNPPPPPQHGTASQTRSLPPTSSYIRSDRSSVSPLPTGLHLSHLNASRSSLPRNIYNPSVGGYSSTTNPSQPVLIRVHSHVASTHDRPASRPPRSRSFKDMSKLPPISEYSFEGIWNTVRGDVEEDVNAIAEIWGQHRLVLADQHESHLPPQGEITGQPSPLQAVAEASASTERLGTAIEDIDVMIANLEGSLVEGSNSGSAAYGLLERLQAIPRTRRMRSDVRHQSPAASASGSRMPARNNSSPAILNDIPVITTVTVSVPEAPASPNAESRRASRNLLQKDPVGATETAGSSRFTGPVVSEVYLLAGADGRVVSDPPLVSEAGRHYPLYSYDESDVFEGYGERATSQPRQLSFRERMQRLVLLRDLGAVVGWRSSASRAGAAHGSRDAARNGTAAEEQLRGILGRQERERPGIRDHPGAAQRPTSSGAEGEE
jgi:hypothetical protein